MNWRTDSWETNSQRRHQRKTFYSAQKFGKPFLIFFFIEKYIFFSSRSLYTCFFPLYHVTKNLNRIHEQKNKLDEKYKNHRIFSRRMLSGYVFVNSLMFSINHWRSTKSCNLFCTYKQRSHKNVPSFGALLYFFSFIPSSYSIFLLRSGFILSFDKMISFVKVRKIIFNFKRKCFHTHTHEAKRRYEILKK